MRPKDERNRLSRREDEVLRLAASGLTDQQIANVLNIRVSTVTTYWVRIRGKVGQLSRAELIALSVRQRSQEAMNELRVENARLKSEVSHRQNAENEALRSAGILKASLDLLPEGMLIVRPDGGVAVSNRAAEGILGRGAKDLEGLCIQDLLPDVPNQLPEAARGSGAAILERPTVAAKVQVRPLEGPAAGWIAVLLEPS